MIKRKTIIGLVGLLLLGSCSQKIVEEPEGAGRDVPETKTKSIAFSTVLPEQQAFTRSTPLESVGITTFKVWGYKNMSYNGSTGTYDDAQTVFPGYTVNWVDGTAQTTTSNTHDWEYEEQGTGQTIKYWDWSSKAYRFFGYTLGTATAPAVPNAVTSASTATEYTFTSTVGTSTQAAIDAAPYFSELWFSNDAANDYGKVVTMNFLKPFARVRFRFMFIDGLTFGREALSKIKFWPTVNADGDPANDRIIANAGTVTVHYPLKGTGTNETWTTSGTTGLQAFTIDWYETTETPDPTQPEVYPNSPEHWYYVLPTSSQGSYTLEVAVVSDEVKTAVVPAEFMTWKPGFEYTYNFKINESGGIVIDIVQVAINDWGNRNYAGHSVYNW